ncbi:hypothetical protein ACJO5Y_13345 [Marinobacter sp. GN3S48]|uniref:hypothetical protein n=1 Tax=Marinobacter sp. GN3S48 TaxID=3382302 RepID=UPI00387B67A8
MSSRPGAEKISQALFETDPMNTCCQENDCFDEYDYIAKAVADSLAEGHSLKEALVKEISEWFFDGESFNADRLKPALERLGKEGK